MLLASKVNVFFRIKGLLLHFHNFAVDKYFGLSRLHVVTIFTALRIQIVLHRRVEGFVLCVVGKSVTKKISEVYYSSWEATQWL